MVNVANITFSSCNYAIRVYAGTLTVAYSIFDNCNSGIYMNSLQQNIRKITIRNNVFSNSAYGVNIEYGNIVTPILIRNNTFNSMSKNPIYIYNSPLVEINMNTFSQFKMPVFFRNLAPVVFNDNYLSFGSGLRVENSDLNMQRCYFSSNSGDKGAGLSMLSTTVNIINSVFTFNSAKTYGGGVYCQSGAGNIFDSKFNLNNATINGGAFYCDVGCQIFFRNNDYSGNTPIWSNDKCEMK